MTTDLRYPSADQYCEALQHLQSVLLDPALRGASVQRNAYGLPVPLSGGFAVTFRCTKGTDTFALRCFHRYVESLEQRYEAISSTLVGLKSPYAVDFEYCRRGIRVCGNEFPIVRMAWVKGHTLGEYLALHHRDPRALEVLAESLVELAAYLESKGIAHGDVQPANLMVSEGRRTLKLIDYDGMYVPSLAKAGASEDGQINFQHPARRGQWSPRLDRFSFCLLWLAIKGLAIKPSLWEETHSDSDALLLRANDFRSPENSEIFRLIRGIGPLRAYADGLAAVCSGPFADIPSLAEFIRQPPSAVSTLIAGTGLTATPYASPYAVLNAADYPTCLRQQGERVELIGRVVLVKEGHTRKGKRPYVFLNFGDWHGEMVRVAIWSHGLESLPQRPNGSWTKKWISCIGLLEAPYVDDRHGYRHLSISVTQAGQLTVIPEAVARFRLGLGSGSIAKTKASDSAPSRLQGTTKGKGTATRKRRVRPPVSPRPGIGSSPQSGRATRKQPPGHHPSSPPSPSPQTPGGGTLPPPPGGSTGIGPNPPWVLLIISAIVLVLFLTPVFLPRRSIAPPQTKPRVAAVRPPASQLQPAAVPAQRPPSASKPQQPIGLKQSPVQSPASPPRPKSRTRLSPPEAGRNRDQLKKDLEELRVSAESVRQAIEVGVPGSEILTINSARAALYVLREARLINQINGETPASDVVLVLFDKAIRNLKASDRELARLIPIAKDPDMLRKIQDFVQQQLAVAIDEMQRAAGVR